MSNLPPYVTKEQVLERLPLIFPEGIPNRNYCIRGLAASTIFTLLYIGALDGEDVYMGPVYVCRMTDEQSALTEESDRVGYRNVLHWKTPPEGKPWYADNTREPIRDETLREGLMQLGAVLAKAVATTSSLPRYYLQKDFAALFDPQVTAEKLLQAIDDWQKKYLSKSARTRLSLAKFGKRHREEKVLVVFPNNETRHLTTGPSADISKAVIEVFAPAFLETPVVLWLSTSDDKSIVRDVEIANSIGLNIQIDKDLPDIILVDLAPEKPLLVFIEVVATDGAITDRRQTAIYGLTDAGRFDRTQVAFVTAYRDRQASGFRKTITGLAWNSFAWFVSEPDKIVLLREGVTYLHRLVEINRVE